MVMEGMGHIDGLDGSKRISADLSGVAGRQVRLFEVNPAILEQSSRQLKGILHRMIHVVVPKQSGSSSQM
jgi:hypothetical protein